jgi:predicted CDP-diglyceride synthetase/phosphatidate cytidylyltransferase
MPKLVATGLTKQEFSKHCADNDGIQSRLEDLDLQPRPKVISVSAAAAVEEEEEKNDPDEAPEEELDYIDLTSRSWWHLVFRKAMKILCANRVGFIMLLVAPAALALGIAFAPAQFSGLNWEAYVTVELTIAALMLMINDLPSDLVSVYVFLCVLLDKKA